MGGFLCFNNELLVGSSKQFKVLIFLKKKKLVTNFCKS